MIEPPRYPVTALDRGLRVLATVRDEGRTRVNETAEQLGVAQSTAHRILRTLVRRGFLEAAEDRSYVPGRALRFAAPVSPIDRELVLSKAWAPMTQLARRLGASTNVVIDGGPEIRVLVTAAVAGGTPDRSGAVLPAHLTAGGRALLSTLSEAEVWSRYPQCAEDLPPFGFKGLVGTVGRARQAGFATAVAEIEPGIAAIGVPLRDRTGRAVAALTVSGRTTANLNGRAVGDTVAALRKVADVIGWSLGPADGARSFA